MIKRRVATAGLPPSTCCHTFRATGITAYLSNGATLEHAQQIAGHAWPKTTKLYDRTVVTRAGGQARPFGAVDVAAVVATCHRSRWRERGIESDDVALERGRVDAVIAGLFLMAGKRR